MASRWQAYRAKWSEAVGDLPYFSIVLIFLFSMGVLTAKAHAAVVAYGWNRIDLTVLAWLHSLPMDLVLIGAMALVALASRKLPRVGGKLRAAVVIALWFFLLASVLVLHANVFFYAEMGRPLNLHILSLAPHMAKYLLPSVDRGSVVVLVMLAAAIAMFSASLPWLVNAIRPHFVMDGRWTMRPHVLGVAPLLIGAGLFLLPAVGIREMALRDLTLAKMFWPGSSAVLDEAKLTENQREKLLGLCGGMNTAGEAAFQTLPRKKYNVVFWVWESVGARYLKSFHPIGTTPTPQIDAAAAKGCVAIKYGYSECALSVQSGWSILTGKTPPAFPAIFVKLPMLPVHGPQVTTILHDEGYRTAVLIGGPTKVWGLDRIVKSARVDSFEDQGTLEEKGYQSSGWGIEGRALRETFFKWVDEDRSTPFFGVVWGVETHHPYTWVGMSEADKKLERWDRYYKSIEHTDREFGLFMDQLASRKLTEDTIVVVVGDHGEGTGRSGRPYDRAHSMHVFEDGIHVPLLFLNPALKGTLQNPVDLVATHADILPTVLDLCGIHNDGTYDGRALSKPVPPRPFFARSLQVWPMSLRAGNYKAVQATEEDRPVLFDLSKDLWEQEDIASRLPELAQFLSIAIRERAAAMQRQEGKGMSGP